MKKITFLCLVLSLIFVLSLPAMAINSPGVVAEHGVLVGLFVSDGDIIFGGEYGFTPQLGISGKIGSEGGFKLAGKYEIKPSLAVLAGVIDSDKPFIGINGGKWINNQLSLLGELDVAVAKGGVEFSYELGARYRLSREIDLRGGFIGSIEDKIKAPALQLGLGYHF